MAGNDNTLIVIAVAAAGLWFLYSSGALSSGGGAFEPNAPQSGGGMTPGNFTVSAAGRANIQQQEGFSLYPYADAGGQSIYWGHHIQPGEVFANTVDDANAYFDSDIANVENILNSQITAPLSQNQVDAVADFVYNEGLGHFLQSQLLQDINAQNYAAAATDFSHFVRGGGLAVNPVLAARRSAEQSLFTQGTGATTAATTFA